MSSARPFTLGTLAFEVINNFYSFILISLHLYIDGELEYMTILSIIERDFFLDNSNINHFFKNLRILILNARKFKFNNIFLTINLIRLFYYIISFLNFSRNIFDRRKVKS